MTTIPDTPSTHEDNAQGIRLELLRLMSGVRGLTLLTPERRRQVTVSGHVDDDFLRSMALLLEAHADIAAPSQITAAEIREHLQYHGSYHGVGEELVLNGRKMIDTLLAERASVGQRALTALKIARDVSEPADREALVPHLEAIDREFSRGRRKRAKNPDAAAAAARKKEKEVKP